MAEVSKPKRSGRAEQGTKDLLLDTAAAILSERGRIDVTLSELGERSGMNTALVRYYFGNKAGMMMALAERTMDKAVAQFDRLMAMDISADEKLILHIKGTITTYFSYPFVNRLLHHLSTIDDGKYANDIANKHSRPIMKLERRILKEGEAQGIFKKIDPTLLNLHIVGACDNLFHNFAFLQELHGIDKVSEDFKQSYSEYVSSTIVQGIRKLN